MTQGILATPPLKIVVPKKLPLVWYVVSDLQNICLGISETTDQIGRDILTFFGDLSGTGDLDGERLMG